VYRYLFLIFNLLAVVLWADGTVSGVATSAQTGLPISGATIDLIHAGTHIIATTTTAMNGSYSITANPSNYTIRASATSFQTQTISVQIKNNQTSTVNFSLQSNPGTISGQVLDAMSAPIPGVTVNILQGDVLAGSATTNAMGNYSVTGLTPNSYIVTANKTGYQTGSVGAIVQSDMTTTVNFTLQTNPGTVSGTVTDLATGLPIEDAHVEAILNDVVIALAHTDSFGNYSLTELAPGSYTISAEATNYQTRTIGATVSAGMTTTVNLALQSNPGTVSGTVTDATTGLPIAGVTVEIHSDITLSTLTDPSGNYTITGLPPGAYVMHAHADDYQTAVTGVIVQSDQTATVNFSLQPNPGTLSGTVIDANTMLPIAGTLIEINAGNIPIETTLTDASGNYSITGVSPGSYVIHAHATNYQISIADATIQSNQTTTTNFSLQSNPGTVSGTVTAAVGGSPIAGATVEANLNDVVIISTLTDSSGNYSLSSLAPGSYVIHAHAEDFQTGISNATVTAGMTTTVNFSLQANPGTVTGVITDAATGLPIGGALVQITFNGTVIYTSLTDSAGTYIETGLAEGNYTLAASKTGYYSASQNFSITTINEIVNIHLALIPLDSPPRNLSGSVINNRFLLQADRIHHLQWVASIDPIVVRYHVYRNGALTSIIPANAPLVYDDHHQSPKVKILYQVTAITSGNSESSPVAVVLQ
jgi:protocatechuate 3,4-dioxygenase beta subunit